MTPPPQPAAAMPQPAATIRPAPSAPSQVTMGSGPWIVPAVVLLVAPLFAIAALKIFEVERATVLFVEYACMAVAAFAVIGTLPPRAPVRLKSPIGKAMLFFVGSLLLTTTLVYVAEIRTDTSKFLPQVAAILFLTLAFFVLEGAAKRADAERAVLLTCHTVLGLSAASVLGDFLHITHYETNHGRYFGFLGDGVAWALTLPLVVYFCSKRLVLVAICAVVIALTGSRAPALCVAAALLLLIAVGRGRRLQYLMLSALAVIAIYQSDVFTTLGERLSATHLSSSDRLTTAALGIKVFENSPVFGSGYNAQAYYFPSNARRIALGQYSIQTSTFVQMLAEGGLLLFGAYLAFVITATVGGISLVRRSQAFRNSGILNGVVVWLLSMLWMNQSAAWFLVGSYTGTLILGMAGVVSGYYARLRYSRGQGLVAQGGQR
ncbi:MAG TPA: O-antigen ligase family protein [Sphingomicrobium sp.]